MPLIPDAAVFRSNLTSLPISIFQPGETVLATGSVTERLVFLKECAVEVIRDGIQIARVSDRGAVFGELGVLLDKPHTADVRAIERAEFHVADATTLLNENPTALLYVAAIMARRLDGSNEALLDVKRQLDTGKPHNMIAKSVANVEHLLSSGGGDLLYAGYPFDPLASPPP